MKSFKFLLSILAMAAVAAAPFLRADNVPSAPPAPAPAASGGADHKGPHGDRLKELSDKLGLTDDQKAKLAPILQDEAAGVKALKDDTSIEAKARRAKMFEIRKSHQEQIIAILTPAQQATFKAMIEPHKKAGPDAPKTAPEPTK